MMMASIIMMVIAIGCILAAIRLQSLTFGVLGVLGIFLAVYLPELIK